MVNSNTAASFLQSIRFTTWLKDQVHKRQHSGKCGNCGRPFGDLVGIPERPRLQGVRMHCPQCGSGHIVSVKKSSVVADGIIYEGLHCRKCGEDSNQFEVFNHCEAPPPTIETKRVEKVQKLTNAVGMAPREFLENLASFQASRGKVSQVITEKLKEFEETEKEPQPGTPEWYEAHPEES